MANFDVTANINLDAFLTANPTYDNTTSTKDDIYISENATFTWDNTDSATSLHYRRLLIGDNSAGTAPIKRGNIDFTKDDVAVELVSVYDSGLASYIQSIGPTASCGECLINIDSDTLTWSCYGFATNVAQLFNRGASGSDYNFGANTIINIKNITITGAANFIRYYGGSNNPTFNIDNVEWTPSSVSSAYASKQHILFGGVDTATYNISNCTWNRNGQNMTWNHMYSVNAVYNFSNITYNDGGSGVGMRVASLNNVDCIWGNYNLQISCDNVQMKSSGNDQIWFTGDSLYTAPGAITVTFTDNADGGANFIIPAISGSPTAYAEFAVRVGGTPDFTDYKLDGRFLGNQTITIYNWNNAGTLTKFNSGDTATIIVRTVNEYTDNSGSPIAGTGGTQALAGATPATWDGTGDDLSLSDNTDGSVDVNFLNTLSGDSPLLYELFVRVGSSPAYSSSYLYGYIAAAEDSIIINSWNNNSTFTAFSSGDDVYIQCRAYNVSGTENASNSPNVIVTSQNVTYEITTDMNAQLQTSIRTEYPNE